MKLILLFLPLVLCGDRGRQSDGRLTAEQLDDDIVSQDDGDLLNVDTESNSLLEKLYSEFYKPSPFYHVQIVLGLYMYFGGLFYLLKLVLYDERSFVRFLAAYLLIVVIIISSIIIYLLDTLVIV